MQDPELSPSPTRFERLGAAALLTISWVLCWAPTRLGPFFGAAFSGYSDEIIPALARFLLTYPNVFLLIALVQTIAFVVYFLNIRRTTSIQVACFVFALMAVPATILIAYLPVFSSSLS